MWGGRTSFLHKWEAIDHPERGGNHEPSSLIINPYSTQKILIINPNPTQKIFKEFPPGNELVFFNMIVDEPDSNSAVHPPVICTAKREGSVLTASWSESTSSSWWLGGPASRHGSLNSFFQVALHLPSSYNLYCTSSLHIRYHRHRNFTLLGAVNLVSRSRDHLFSCRHLLRWQTRIFSNFHLFQLLHTRPVLFIDDYWLESRVEEMEQTSSVLHSFTTSTGSPVSFFLLPLLYYSRVQSRVIQESLSLEYEPSPGSLYISAK